MTETQVGRNPSEGQAAIGAATAQAPIYSVGGVLVDGTVLKEVHEDFVILDRDGDAKRLPTRRALRQRVELAPENDVSPLADVAPILSEPSTSETITTFARIAPEFKDGAVAGVRIYPAPQNSQLSNVGLMPRDVVTAIDHQPITSVETYTKAIRPVLEGGRVSATLVRNGTSVSIDIDGSRLSH